MTTAHRPTWAPALASGSHKINTKFRSKFDAPSHLSLKKRGDIDKLAEVKQQLKRRQEETRKRQRPEDDPDEDLASSESSDDEDETGELMRELEKLRREKTEEQERRAKQLQEQLEKEKEEAMLTGNPLVKVTEPGADFKTKRRWNDDVVFKNQARSEPEPKKRFINDVLRSDFHKRFMSRYLR
eukprot:TRINITY_DN2674_c0_g1_i1.p1 TRINITY_DN2674_c0_g1~~TRINITY_DN2674_c0_g1_i1.p1  ORF type:complete len:184 (+),score=58.52 TRINITY_DN2674_c0_g1_i1:263-814(+)